MKKRLILVFGVLAVVVLSLALVYFVGRPDLSVESDGDSGGVDEGYTLFASIGEKSAYLIDMDGDVVHEWGNVGKSVYLLDEGNLLATDEVKSEYFKGETVNGGVTKILDWDGDEVWSYELNNEKYLSHHDVEHLDNGNILVIAYEKILEDEALDKGVDKDLIVDGEVWAEAIFEVDSEGEVVWEWHVWDHLLLEGMSAAEHPELIDPNYPKVRRSSDWLHFNSVDYNEELNFVAVSSRHMNEFFVIDRESGEIVYRFGNPASYGGSGDQVLYGQHNVQWIDAYSDSDILLYNNGDKKVGRDYSSVLELDLGDYSFGEAEIVWDYGGGDEDVKFFSDKISGAQRLPDGNTLICVGDEGWFFEVGPDGESVWEYFVEKGKGVFRAERYYLDLDYVEGEGSLV